MENKKIKGRRRQKRRATAKAKVVSVRFGDTEYFHVEKQVKNRGLSVGEYLRWLTRSTSDGQKLEVEEW